MSVLADYIAYVKRIDTIIHNMLKGTLQLSERDRQANTLRGEQLSKLFKLFERKVAMLLSLFEGSFSENQEIVRNYMQRQSYKVNKSDNMYENIVCNIIHKRVNNVLDEFIECKKSNHVVSTIAIDRKLFLNEILQKRVNFDLKKLNSRQTSDNNEI